MAAPRLGFQAFTIKGNGIVDRVITDLEVFVAFDPASIPDPPPKAVSTKALWDTGATRSAISPDLAKTLGLVAVGASNVNHAGGVSLKPNYLVNFGLPHGVLIAGIMASEFDPAPNGFGAIVGMDVICSGDFAITNVSGQSCISFRTPSCDTVDYVVEANRANRARFAGIGRNDPCPCGTGKKFKKCHGGPLAP